MLSSIEKILALIEKYVTVWLAFLAGQAFEERKRLRLERKKIDDDLKVKIRQAELEIELKSKGVSDRDVVADIFSQGERK